MSGGASRVAKNDNRGQWPPFGPPLGTPLPGEKNMSGYQITGKPYNKI